MIITTGEGAAAVGTQWGEAGVVGGLPETSYKAQNSKSSSPKPALCGHPARRNGVWVYTRGVPPPKAPSVSSKRVPEPPPQAPSVYPRRRGLDVCFLNKQPQ